MTNVLRVLSMYRPTDYRPSEPKYGFGSIIFFVYLPDISRPKRREGNSKTGVRAEDYMFAALPAHLKLG